MSDYNDADMNNMLSFVFQPPCECGQEDCDCDEKIISMDCNAYCEQVAQLAEQVAAGEDLDTLLPRFREHLHHFRDCREEFDALVAIIRADGNGELNALIDEVTNGSAPSDQ